jgi:hypothetical protein
MYGYFHFITYLRGIPLRSMQSHDNIQSEGTVPATTTLVLLVLSSDDSPTLRAYFFELDLRMGVSVLADLCQIASAKPKRLGVHCISLRSSF